MAINDTNESDIATAAASALAGKQGTGKGTGKGTGSTFSMQGLFGAPISRGVGSEYLNKLVQGLTEIYKQTVNEFDITLITLDNVNEAALAFSSILVCVNIKDHAKQGVAAHILLVESTGDKIMPVFENINNVQTEITRCTGDAIDSVLVTKVQEKLALAFPGCRTFIVDGEVVPTTFDLDSKTDMHSLALNAAWACGTEVMINRTGFTDLDLTKELRDTTLVVNVGFNRTQIRDAVGLPMRSDVLMNFSSQKQNQGRAASINSNDREMKLTEISGFVDLLWNPSGAVNQMGLYQAYNQPLTHKYVARLVMTNLASNFSYTPASVLLALSTSTALSLDNNWVQSFRPQASHDGIDMADIGAINIEANISNEPAGFGTRIDTKSDSFKLTDLGQLVSTLVAPGIIMSMDCPETGPQSWYLSMFAAAAAGNRNAINRIITAAKDLTGGAFTRYFAEGTPIFTDVNNRIHLGYWIDKYGMKRDIRDIDTLAVANLIGERNPQLIRDWSDTFLRTSYPLPMRLAARKKIIMALTNESAVFTGFAQRVTYTKEFMVALEQSIHDTGLGVRVNTPLSSAEFQNQRGVASFAGSALMQPGQSFMTSGGMAYQNQYAGQQYSSTRWGM